MEAKTPQEVGLSPKEANRGDDVPPEIGFVVGSDNVFADLGLPEPEICQAKAMISIEIERILKERGLTQEETGRIMGISQPKVSDLLQGRLAGFTFDRLFRFLNALGKDVRIFVADKSPESENAVLEVVTA